MANWRWKCDIKKFLSDDESPEAMEDTYAKITEALRKHVPLSLPMEWRHFTKIGIREKSVEIWNIGLDRLYDWADRHRIWLGI